MDLRRSPKPGGLTTRTLGRHAVLKTSVARAASDPRDDEQGLASMKDLSAVDTIGCRLESFSSGWDQASSRSRYLLGVGTEVGAG